MCACMVTDIIHRTKQHVRGGEEGMTYVDSISRGRVRRELTEPVNRHLYIRPGRETTQDRKT